MDAITYTLLSILVLLLIILYTIINSKFKYWDNRGVTCLKQIPILGSILPHLVEGVPVFDGVSHVYRQFPGEKLIGAFNITRPALIVRDPELIGRILVKDFHHFTDHDDPKVDKTTLFNLGLFNLTGNEWRSFRNKISPTFTSGKIKNMFDEMLPCADNFVQRVDSSSESDVDFEDFVESYALDISSNVVFGIEMTNENIKSEYKKHAKVIFGASLWKLAGLILAASFPKLAKALGVRMMNQNAENFFRGIVDKTFNQRSDLTNQRNDYVQLLLKLKQQGRIEVPKFKDPEDDYLIETQVNENYDVTDDILAAQALQFLTAGFENVYNAILFLIYELSNNYDVQCKVRSEIEFCLQKNGGYSYKALQDMTYLEQCLNETLRKYPIIPFLIRMCVKDYKIDERLTVEKGVMCLVPIYGLHMDPEHYQDPDNFDPERFHTDASITPFTYLPFGAGPRMCIGMRFAMLEIKLVVAKLIQNHVVSLSSKTDIPLKLKYNSFFISPQKMYFNVSKIEQ